MKKLSIIIPVYNVKDYLRQCVDSLICEREDYEVLLIDDGSTDGSSEICDEYAKKHKVVKVFHKKNGGVSSARNYGLQEAIGEYIYFVDGDDFVVGIESLISSLSQAEGCVVNCTILDINEDVKQKYEYSLQPFLSIEKDYRKMKRTFHASWSFVYRRDIIYNKGLFFDEELKYAEDWIFVVQYMTLISHVKTIDGFAYYYRKDRIGSATNTQYSEEQILKYFRAYDKMCKIKPLRNKRYYNIENRKFISYILSVVKHNINKINDISQLQKLIRNEIKLSVLNSRDLKFSLKVLIALIDIRCL